MWLYMLNKSELYLFSMELVYFDICSAMVGSSKPCELWPPMSTVLCGSFISSSHNMVIFFKAYLADNAIFG
jgi:hypothetical protein